MEEYCYLSSIARLHTHSFLYTHAQIENAHTKYICTLIFHGIYAQTTVPEFQIGPNTQVNESTPDVEICITTSSSLGRDVVVTAETGPKRGAANQATGKRLEVYFNNLSNFQCCECTIQYTCSRIQNSLSETTQ